MIHIYHKERIKKKYDFVFEDFSLETQIGNATFPYTHPQNSLPALCTQSQHYDTGFAGLISGGFIINYSL